MNFLISVYYNIQRTWIFGASCLHTWVNKDVIPLSFLYEIQFCATFVWGYFQYVLKVFSPKVNFLILIHYISRSQIVGAPSSTPGVDRDMRMLSCFKEIEFCAGLVPREAATGDDEDEEELK